MFFKPLYIGLKQWISRQHWIHLNLNAKGIHTCPEVGLRNTCSLCSPLVHCLIFGVRRINTIAKEKQYRKISCGKVGLNLSKLPHIYFSLKSGDLRIHLSFMLKIKFGLIIYHVFFFISIHYFLVWLSFFFCWAYFVIVVHLAAQSTIPRVWNFITMFEIC